VAAVRRAVEQALKWMAPATPVFAAEAAPTETGCDQGFTLYLWEILWFSASRFPTFGDIFVLILHQGECHSRKLPGQDYQRLGCCFTRIAMLFVDPFPSGRPAG